MAGKPYAAASFLTAILARSGSVAAGLL